MATRFGFISTYPPTQCGLATFTAALRQALGTSGVTDGRVVRLVDVPDSRSGAEVASTVLAGPSGVQGSADALNDCDVVIVQHEYGVYGGTDGDDILRLLAELTVPTIVVLHTVLVTPTRNQRRVLELVAAAATAVVTMTATARDRLAAGYHVDLGKVSIIAHGAPDSPARTAVPTAAVFRSGQPTVLTWGLIGPGKGVEWGIEAMALLDDLRPAPKYIVAGQTHPKVAARDGEKYREGLGRLIHRHRLSGSVTLDPQYRDAGALSALIGTADVVLLPYDSTDQVTSGVLIEAVAAGKPVVATGFPHAVELLSGGAGLVVPHRDPAAIAAALRTVLTRSDVSGAMASAAVAAAPHLRWSAVAEEYRQLAGRLLAAAAVAA